MLPIQFTYLFGASLFFLPWSLFYIYRKDLRQMLVQFGLLAIGLGLLAEYLWWTKDWWRPQTITNTIIGLEDVILAFFSAGVSAGLYLFIFKKKFHVARGSRPNRLLFVCILAFNLVLFGILFMSGINSFVATIITFALASGMLLWIKKGLIIPALISGGLMVMLVTPIYLAMFWLTPMYVQTTWLTHNLLGIYPWGIPLEDLVFYFVGGVLGFSVYPFYNKAELMELN